MTNERRFGRRKEDGWIDQAIGLIETRVEKTESHVKEIDDYLRGVGTGRMSLDTRFALMEAELHAQGILVRRMSEQFGTLMSTSNTQLSDIKDDISSLKIQKGIADGTEAVVEKREATKLERFKEWMRLWGALVTAGIALIVPLASLLVHNMPEIRAFFSSKSSYTVKANVDQWLKEIERRKKDPATKKYLKEKYGVEE